MGDVLQVDGVAARAGTGLTVCTPASFASPAPLPPLPPLLPFAMVGGDAGYAVVVGLK